MKGLTGHIYIGILMLCILNGISCIVLRNLAYRKQAYQTSTAFSGVARRAVDGNTDGRYNSNSCSHTQNEAGYWEVDLGQGFIIDRVIIYDRTDSYIGVSLLRKVELYVGKDHSSYTLVGTYNDPVVRLVTFDITPRRLARWVRVTRHPTVASALVICEVKVFGQDTKVKFRRIENSSGIGEVVAEYSGYSSTQCSNMCTYWNTCAGFNVQAGLCSLLSTSLYELAPNSNTTFYVPMT